MDAKDKALHEIAELTKSLTEYERSYFQEGRSLVSDAEYDRLFERLRHLEAEYPEAILPDSPSQRAGSDLTQDLPEADHQIPVLSLDKVYSAEELGVWQQRMQRMLDSAVVDIVCEEKIDGVSIVLYYTKGILERALTRGNGYVGNDVTANIRTIRSIPLRLPEAVSLAVRGEVFLHGSDFEKLNSSMEVPYANPRNLAAGTIRRVVSSSVAQIPLKFFAYDMYMLDSVGSSTHHQALMRMQDYGFPVNRRLAWLHSPDHPAQEVEAFRQSFPEALVGTHTELLADYIQASTQGRSQLDYEIDGLVAKLDDVQAREQLGYTGHHPRWAVAYKFNAPQGASRVLDIDVQVGRTGRITPVARIEPVRIGGSVIRNVTLHNQDYIAGLELNVGDSVAVSKRGDVIPAIEQVIDKGDASHPYWQMPQHCPSCGASLEVHGAHCFCPNRYGCPAQLRGRLQFFVARGQMDIEGLGPETLETLSRLKLVQNIADIYTADYSVLENEPGFGAKKIDAIRKGIKQSLAVPYRRVLPSLGVPELGPKVVQLLCDAGIRSVQELFSIADENDEQRLSDIHGIGQKTARTLIDELKDSRLRQLVVHLQAQGLQFNEAEPSEDSEGAADTPFKGQVWVITGSFQEFQPRSRAAELITKLGGNVVGAISGSTTHLLAGSGAGSKYDKALERGMTVVNEEQFLAMLPEGGQAG